MTRVRALQRGLRTRVGMFVALSNCDMFLSELIIVYLAAAAPFGVANFLRRPAGTTRTHALLRSTGAALLWPLALLSRSLVQKKFRRVAPDAATPEVSSARELLIADARRALLSSLYRTADLSEEVCGANTAATQEAVREAIASVERYVGLALAVADAGENVSHAPRETELCRISGRTGDDLHIAALCHQRRNDARLRAHQADSQLELLHALAELREVSESTFAATQTDAHAGVRPLFAALLETYARAIDLLSLFEDGRAARKVARLLDAACARLRRIESLNPQAAPEQIIQTPDTTDGTTAPEGEPCTTPIPQTNPQTQLSSTQTIRAHG
jgi:hypothetical protein